MVRCYLEVYSKGNERFLRCETMTRNNTIADEVSSQQDFSSQRDETVTIVFQNDNYAVLKVEDADFVEIVTFSTL